ncbi:hypothetical protein J7L67_05615 [bacterium]|nr:hypothetical protein [bacterium]
MLKRNGYQRLRRMMSLLLIQLFIITQVGFSAVPSKVNYNEKYGRTRESFKGNQDKKIIHIQDAHCVGEAQKNIVGIVRDLYKNHNIRLIAVEGADAYFNADDLSTFPVQSAKNDVAEYFLNQGRISGSEYLMIQNDLPLAFRGAESRDLYIDNYNSFLASMPKPDDTLFKRIDEIDAALEALKIKMLNDTLLAMEDKIRLNATGRMAFIDFANYIIKLANENNVSYDKYNHINTLVKAQGFEQKIDFAKIHVELSDLIDLLTEKIDKNQLTQLLNKNLYYKIGRIQPNVFFVYLKELCDETDMDVAPFENLSRYTDYLSLYESIDDVEIIKQVTDLENDIKDTLYTDSAQKQLVENSKNLVLLRKLLELKVSKAELLKFRENKSLFSEQTFLSFLHRNLPTYKIPFNFNADFSVISSRLPLVDNFYNVASKRNEALIENTLSEMDLEDSNIAILITGGFHTQGITELLRDEGIFYEVISPSITEQPKSTPYLARLIGEPTQIESVLSANQLQVPLVLADPSIIPDAAKKAEFLRAFKALLETHPDAVNLAKILAEKETGYVPELTFIDAFATTEVENGREVEKKYVAFNLAGQKFYMVFAPKGFTALNNTRAQDMGKYSFAVINEQSFLNASNNPDKRVISARTNIDSKIETALARGESIDTADLQNLDAPDAAAVARYQKLGMLQTQDDGSVKPTISYMLNSRISALVVSPTVANISALSIPDSAKGVFEGINKIEVYSNQTDLTAEDVKNIEDGLPDLITNNKITLKSAKVVRAVVDSAAGVVQIYSLTPQGKLQLKPQIVINDNIFNAMLPDAPKIDLENVAKAEKVGYINVDASARQITVYQIGENGERTVVDAPITFSPNVTSAELLQNILDARKLAQQEGVALVGYGNPKTGIGVSFDNLGDLLESVNNSDLVKAFTNVAKLLSVAPSLQDMDITGINTPEALYNYLLDLMPKAGYEEKITCAAAAGAILHNDITIGNKIFDNATFDMSQILARMLPLIDVRMKGAISYNDLNQPEYSLYAISKAYQVFERNNQAVNIANTDALYRLLEALPTFETVIVRVTVDGQGHFIAINKSDQGYKIIDNLDGAQITSPIGAQIPELGLEALKNTFNTVYKPGFTGQALVSQSNPLTAGKLQALVSPEAFPEKDITFMDIDMQLTSSGSCGTMSMLPLRIEAGSIEPIRKALKSLARIDYRGSDSHSLQISFIKPMTLPDDDNEYVDTSYIRTFKVAYNTVSGKLEVLVKEVIDDKTTIYLTMGHNGQIIQQTAPTKKELEERGISLPDWEHDFAMKYANDEVAALMGEDMKGDVGIYGPKIKGLKASNIKSHMPDLIERITTVFTKDLTDPSIRIVNVTGQVRWATHGESNILGAHPHTVGPQNVTYDTNVGTVSVVHNGVFYGYQAHRKNLDGHIFKTPVDTEVFAHLIFRYIHDYEKSNGKKPDSLKEAVQHVMEVLEFDDVNFNIDLPTYSLQVTSTDYPNEIVTAKRVSPVYLAISDEASKNAPFVYYASDPKATIPHTKYYSDLLDDGMVFSSKIEGISGTRIMREQDTIHELPVIIILPDGSFTDGQFTKPGVMDFKKISITIENKETGEQKTVTNLNDIEEGLTGNDFVALVKPKGKYADGKFRILLDGAEAAFIHMRVGKDRPDIYERGEYETYTEKELAQCGDAIVKTIEGNREKIPVYYIENLIQEVSSGVDFFVGKRIKDIVDKYDGEKGSFANKFTPEQLDSLLKGEYVVIEKDDQTVAFAMRSNKTNFDTEQRYYFDPDSGNVITMGQFMPGYAGIAETLDPTVHNLTSEELAKLFAGETVTKMSNELKPRKISISMKPSIEEQIELARGRMDYLNRVKFKMEKGEELIPSLNIPLEELAKIDRIWLFSTGSSFNADLASQSLFRLPGVTTEIIDNDTFRDAPNLDSRVGASHKILAVFTSQSGTTQVAVMNAELLNVYNQDPKSFGYDKFLTLTDTNTPGSMLTERTEGQINEHAGPEIAVASQKAVHAQMTNKFLLAQLLRRVKGISDPLTESVNVNSRLMAGYALSNLLKLDTPIDHQIDDWAERFSRVRAMFIIYRGEEDTEGAAKETVLKFQELARIFGTPLQSGLFLHGPVALVEKVEKTRESTFSPVAVWDAKNKQIISSSGLKETEITSEKDLLNTPVLAFYMPKADKAEEVGAKGRFESNLQSIIARGANVYVITTKDYGEYLVNGGFAFEYIPVESIHDAIAVGQRMAVRIAKAKVKNVADPLQQYVRDFRALMVDIEDPLKTDQKAANLDAYKNKMLDLAKTLEVLKAGGELNDLVQPQVTARINSLMNVAYEYADMIKDTNSPNIDVQINAMIEKATNLLNEFQNIIRAIDVDKPKDLAKSVTVENRYSKQSLNKLRTAFGVINLEQNDMAKLIERGPFILDENANIRMLPQRLLDIVAKIQNRSVESITQEGVYHELIEKTLATSQGRDILESILTQMTPITLKYLKDAFVKEFAGAKGFVDDTDMMREVVAKVYTNKLINDPTSVFFQDEKIVEMIDTELDKIISEIAPNLFAAINPTSTDATVEIARIVQDMQQKLSMTVPDDIQNAIVSDEEREYVEQMISMETLAAIKEINRLNPGISVEEALKQARMQSERIAEDLELAKSRSIKDVSQIPNITAMNVSFFKSEDGISNSRTVGMAQKIKELSEDQSNVFVVYSLTDDTDFIKKELASKGIAESDVVVIGSDTIEASLVENEKYDQGAPVNINRLPALIKSLIGLEVDLNMKDLTIIEDNPDIVQEALDNLASVFEMPSALIPDELSDQQEIEMGMDAFELASMLESGESLPPGLIVTQVSAKNTFILEAFNVIKEQNGGQDVTLGELRNHLGLQRLNKSDLRGMKLKRKLQITNEFINKLKAQRALDISA